MMASTSSPRSSEIPPGGRKLVEADGRAIVVFNLGGEFFALSNRCPHRGGSLCDGRLTGLVRVRRAGRIQLQPARRDHPLPVARLGVRHPHRQVLVRSGDGCAPAASACRWSRAPSCRGALRGGDVPGQRRERIRGGRGLNPMAEAETGEVLFRVHRHRGDGEGDRDRQRDRHRGRRCMGPARAARADLQQLALQKLKARLRASRPVSQDSARCCGLWSNATPALAVSGPIC